MTRTRESEVTTVEMTNIKSMVTTTMTLMNRQKRNKRLGVAGAVVLIVIHKK